MAIQQSELTAQEIEPLGVLARRIFALQRRSPLRVIHHSFRNNLSVRTVILSRLRRMVSLAWRYAAIVSRARGIFVARQLRDLYSLAFRQGVNPAVYYALQLYDRPDGLAAANHYLARRETKSGIYNLLIDQRPEVQARAVAIRDKSVLATHCRRLGLPAAAVLAEVRDGKWIWHDDATAALDLDLFIKPAKSKGAIGAAAYQFQPPEGYIDSKGAVLTRAALLARLERRSLAKAMLVMPRLRNHPDIADLAADSLIAFRVFTCTDAMDNPHVTHGMLRVLGKLEPDWGILDEYGAAIDLQTGELGQMCSDIDLAPQSWWDRHPQTGAQVKGRIIAQWPEIAALAQRAHRAFPQRKLVGWDIALTPTGPMLLEGNLKPDTHFLQRVHRQMIGQSPLAPLLRHHLKVAEQRLLDLRTGS